MANPLQDDYVRYPKSTRARTPQLAALWKRAADKGLYHITQFERFWVDLQPYFASKGYRLRPRYTPGWEPVWVGTDINPHLFEESVSCHVRASPAHWYALTLHVAAEYHRRKTRVRRTGRRDQVDSPRCAHSA